jgi:hypothetical protein
VLVVVDDEPVVDLAPPGTEVVVVDEDGPEGAGVGGVGDGVGGFVVVVVVGAVAPGLGAVVAVTAGATGT